MAITAPYNFVPLNEYVYVPDWMSQISHDIPFSDGEDGTIDIIIKTLSPLFIRNASPPKGIVDNYSTHVVDSAGNKHYFIPATTIKGMLNGVMEVFSFARMKQFNDDYFAYRIMDKGQTDGGAYANKMRNVKSGWLCKKGDALFLTPCAGEFEQISESEVKNLFPRYNREKGADEKQKSVQDRSGLYPIVRSDFRLVCTGTMTKKKHEYLFPVEMQQEVPIPDSVKCAFMTVHKPTPLFEKYYLPKLKEGDAIPVFFLQDGKGEVQSVGLSRMFRYPYKHHVAAGVKQKNEKKEPLSTKERDLCQAIWGYVDEHEALKGRVHVGNAFTLNPIGDNELKAQVEGILGEPSASYYPLYLRQTAAPYNTYDTPEIEIAGRKRYRIHKGETVTPLPQGEGTKEKRNEKVISTFRPLPSGLTFHLRISVHNLRKIEIGALLSSITFHQTNAFHNIGLAKGYGYGKVRCSISSMSGFNYQKEEYLKAFENELSHFLHNVGKGLWADSEQVRVLIGIANEHDDCELEMMDLDGYKNGKKNSEFDKLNERHCAVTPYLDRSAFFSEELRRKNEPLFAEAHRLEAAALFVEAIAKYEEILKKLSGYDVADIETRIEELNRKINEIAENKVRLIEEQRLAANQIPLSEKIQHQTKIPTVLGGAKTWMKLNGLTEMSASDKETLKGKLKALYINMKPKEQTAFHHYKQWKELDVLIGSELANEWFKEIVQ